MTEVECTCEGWGFYTTHYNETFYWDKNTLNWYVRWVSLSDKEGYSQVSRYAIPITYCPLCGGKLKIPKGS